jgi:uroporphyrinogen decarboxylase
VNSSERLYARLAGRPVDKIPNLNIYMHIVAREAGASYREFVQDYRKLAEGNLVCAEKYGADHVCVISDPMREASAYGTDVVFPENGVPYARRPLIADDFDLSALERYDPLESPHTLDRVKGCELLRQKAGRDYPVIGWLEGCIAEAADLRGLNGLLEDLALEESYLDDLFEILFAQQKRFAKAQVDAGADIIGVGNAAASLIGPGIYRKYGLGRDKAIVDYIHSLGAKVKLHICGNITPILELLREVGPDILDIDWMVDFALAVKVFDGSKTAVSGNVDPVAVLMQGTPEYVESEVRRCVGIASPTTCIAAGCEVPAAAPDENLFLMDRLLYTVA